MEAASSAGLGSLRGGARAATCVLYLTQERPQGEGVVGEAAL